MVNVVVSGTDLLQVAGSKLRSVFVTCLGHIGMTTRARGSGREAGLESGWGAPRAAGHPRHPFWGLSRNPGCPGEPLRGPPKFFGSPAYLRMMTLACLGVLWVFFPLKKEIDKMGSKLRFTRPSAVSGGFSLVSPSQKPLGLSEHMRQAHL